MAYQGLTTLFGFVEYLTALLVLSQDLCRVTNLLSTICFGKVNGEGAWVVRPSSSKIACHRQWHVERMVWDGPGHQFTCMGAMGRDGTGPNYFRRCEWCCSLLMMLGGQQCLTATCWVDGAGVAWHRNSVSTCAVGWELVAYKRGLQRTLRPSR